MEDFRAGRKMLRYDYLLIVFFLLLTAFGLVTLYSASYLFALNQPGRFEDGMTPLKGNLWAAGFGIFFFTIASLLKFDHLNKKGVVFFLILATIIINILPFLKPFQKIPAENEAASVYRWIYLKLGGRSVSFQPSEVIKLVLPVYLAYIIDKKKDNIRATARVLFPALFWTGIFCALVFLQGNFSETLFIAAVSLAVCFVGGVKLREILVALLALGFIVFILYNYNDKIKGRIDDFINRRQGDQIELSQNAIKSGGFWGKGIGQGTLKVKVPEVHGDFIFASFAEESGFFGIFLFFGLTGFWACTGFREAWRNRNRFSQILGIALVTSLAAQTLMNVIVVSGIIPTTGIPLPFVSSGGSSLMMTLIIAGLIVNVSRQNYTDGGYYVG